VGRENGSVVSEGFGREVSTVESLRATKDSKTLEDGRRWTEKGGGAARVSTE